MNPLALALLPMAFLLPPSVPRDHTRQVAGWIEKCRAESVPVCRIPAGSYNVRPSVLKMLSGVMIDGTGAVLSVLPSNAPGSPHIVGEHYYVFGCIECQGAGIRGFRIIGERRPDRATWSEHRHLVFVLGGRNVTISGVTLERSEGDGVCEYPTLIDGERTATGALNVSKVTCRTAGRNCVSILSARPALISDLTAIDTNGRSPQSALCIEPEHGDAPIVVAERLTCRDNRGSCVDIALQHTTDLDPPAEIRVRGVTSAGDGSGVRLGGSARPRVRPYGRYTVSISDVHIERAKWSGVVVGLPDPTYDATYPVKFEAVLMRDCANNWLWHLDSAFDGAPITIDESCGWTGKAEFPKGVQR